MPAKVYLQPEGLKQSGHHTAYVGDGRFVKPGEQPQVYKLEFFNGIAHNVDDTLYQRFKDAGIADTKRPQHSRREE